MSLIDLFRKPEITRAGRRVVSLLQPEKPQAERKPIFSTEPSLDAQKVILIRSLRVLGTRPEWIAEATGTNYNSLRNCFKPSRYKHVPQPSEDDLRSAAQFLVDAALNARKSEEAA